MSTREATAKTRSPIKLKPLRDPGQSLREGLQDIFEGEVFPWLAVAVMLTVWAVLEWVFYLANVGRSPVMFSLVAAAAIALAAVKIRQISKRVRGWRQGIEGERAVGQFLETLRSCGYLVLHDLPEDGYNVDHVLLGRSGIYAIETKTLSKPVGRDPRIVYDGRTVLVDGHTPDRDPVRQAAALADRVREIIREKTGESPDVRPVVLYPGWFIQRTCRSPSVWVLNEKYLPGWLDHEPEVLSDAEVRRYAAVLADHVRNQLGQVKKAT